MGHPALRCLHQRGQCKSNLRSVGEQLIGLASVSAGAFRSFLRERFIYTGVELLEELHGIVEERRWKSKDWLDEMDSFASSIRLSMLNAEAIVPTDLANILGLEESLV